MQENKKKRVIHFRPLFYLFLAFLLGVVFARKIYSGDVTYIIATVVLFMLLLSVCLYRKKFLPFVLCMLIFAVGNGSYFLSITPYLSAQQYTDNVVVVGRATDNVSSYDYYTKYLLEDVSINGKSTYNLFVTIYGKKEICVGSKLSFETHVE